MSGLQQRRPSRGPGRQNTAHAQPENDRGGHTRLAQLGNGAVQDRIRQSAQASNQQGGVVESALQGVVSAALGQVPRNLQAYARTHLPIILRQCAMSKVKNAKQVAYILATAEHESGFGRPQFNHSEPLVEDRNPISKRGDTYRSRDHVNGRRVSGKSQDEVETKYWDSAYGGRLGNRRGTTDAKNYRGRGYVQLTGRSNYQDMSRRLNAEGFTYTFGGKTYGGRGNPIDLEKNYEHVNKVPELAAKVMVLGSTQGSFTGKKLGDYVNDGKTDYKNARRVINGDVAENGNKIARAARRYERALGGWSRVFAPERSMRG